MVPNNSVSDWEGGEGEGFARYTFPFHFTSTVLTFPFFPFLFICPAIDTASYLIFFC